MIKKALKDQHGLFQSFQSDVVDYNTRDSYLAQRGGKSQDPKKLYGLGPEHSDSYQPKREKPGSLSTRYVPGRPGVQAMRVSSGVYQDPQTKEMFDYNEGFTTSDGRVFRGGTVDLQTDLVTLANRLDTLGMYKDASFLDSIILKIAGDTEASPCSQVARYILNGLPYGDPEANMSALVSMLESDDKYKELCEKIINFTGGIDDLMNPDEPDLMDSDENDSMGLGEEDSLDKYNFADDPSSSEVGQDPELSQAILEAAMSSVPNRGPIS